MYHSINSFFYFYKGPKIGHPNYFCFYNSSYRILIKSHIPRIVLCFSIPQRKLTFFLIKIFNVYRNTIPNINYLWLRSDINGDGAFNNLDIAPFSELLTGSPTALASMLPEPSSFLICAVGALSCLRRRFNSRCP